MKTRLAFYRAEYGNIVDKTIALWTSSLYSHVEIVVGDDPRTAYWYSTSPRLLRITKRHINYDPDKWRLIDVDIDLDRLEKIYNETKGAKYDFLGILLSEIIPLDIHNQNRWYCSEWCSYVLDLENTRMSPQKLYEEITK